MKIKAVSAAIAMTFDPLGNILDPLDRADRCAAVFLNDQCHPAWNLFTLVQLRRPGSCRAAKARD